MICLSRSDLNIEISDESQETRTNYNKLFPVKNGKINCNDYGEYNLTDLCFDYDSHSNHPNYCTLATGKRIVLNPE